VSKGLSAKQVKTKWKIW